MYKRTYFRGEKIEVTCHAVERAKKRIAAFAYSTPVQTAVILRSIVKRGELVGRTGTQLFVLGTVRAPGGAECSIGLVLKINIYNRMVVVTVMTEKLLKKAVRESCREDEVSL